MNQNSEMELRESIAEMRMELDRVERVCLNRMHGVQDTATLAVTLLAAVLVVAFVIGVAI